MKRLSRENLSGSKKKFLKKRNYVTAAPLCDLSESDIYSQLQSIFKDISLSRLPKFSPNAPPDALANYIVENARMFEKAKIHYPSQNEETMEHTVVNMDDVKRDCAFEEKTMLLAFMDFFQEFFDAEISSKSGTFDKEITMRLLHQHFLYCRSLLIEHLVEEFDGQYSTAAIMCFVIESSHAYLVRKYFFHIDDTLWESMVSLMILPRKRRKNWIDPPLEGPVAESIKSFEKFIFDSKREYPDIFNGDRISENAESMQIKEKTFTCGVCFDDFPLRNAVSCSFPDLKPSSSTTMSNNNSGGRGSHRFCVECIRGQAMAATTEMPLADGGVGLCCMESGCNNPILFSKCRSLIPYRVRKILNERIIEETLGMAKLENLERCKRCSYGVIIEAAKKDFKVFACRKCGFEYCRLCDRDWDDQHFGKPCEELDELEKVDRTIRNVQSKMSEAIIRKCPKCGLPFVKWDGCNKMTCRCGLLQCYLCRTSNITYEHFCRHMRQPGQIKCNHCNKPCLLWEKEDICNKSELEKIRKEALEMGVIIDKNGHVKAAKSTTA